MTNTRRRFSEKGLATSLRSVRTVGLGISDKKIIQRKSELQNKWLFPTEFLLFRGTENSRNSVSNPSAKEKTTRNSIPWNRNRSKFSEFLSESFRGRENNTEQNAAAAVYESTHFENSCRDRKNWFPPPWLKDILFNIKTVPLNFIFKRKSVPFRTSEMALSWNSECLGMSSFFCGIKETFRV